MAGSLAAQLRFWFLCVFCLPALGWQGLEMLFLK
jgi:hypothetical protein